MTLEESIKHYEEEAEKCERVCESIPFDSRVAYQEAKEYRQIAVWLKELNNIKHLFNVTEKLFKANFRGGLIDVVDGYDILFSEHKQLREIFEEVNADAVSD